MPKVLQKKSENRPTLSTHGMVPTMHRTVLAHLVNLSENLSSLFLFKILPPNILLYILALTALAASEPSIIFYIFLEARLKSCEDTNLNLSYHKVMYR